MRKAFIIDTNVLLFDPQAMYKFGNNDVVIPIVVLEEIDRFKRDMSENGRHARLFSRLLDKMRSDGELSKGVKLPNGGLLTVELGDLTPLPVELQMDRADNRILALAVSLRKEQPKRPIIFVTKYVNLRIKADALGITATDYEPDSVTPEELYA
ncbi:MAG: PIN domain-containing protein, partial [Bdellovibrionota bacterium]